jgi:hypothetical protein
MLIIVKRALNSFFETNTFLILLKRKLITMKNFSNLFLVALLSGVTTLGAYKLLFDSNGYFSKDRNSIVTLAPNNYGKTVGLSSEAVDFTEAAEKAVHTVVHVKNVSYTSISNPMMEFFYG